MTGTIVFVSIEIDNCYQVDNHLTYYQPRAVIGYQYGLTVFHNVIKGKTLKKLSILALSATVAITPAFAETQTVVLPQTTVSATTPQADLSFAFDDAENLQTKEMTLAEMQETEGAALPFAPLLLLGSGGGAVGAWGNHYNSYKNTGKPASVSSTLEATGKGVVTGVSMYGAGRGVQAVRAGKEIKIGNNFRLAPFGNATGHPVGKFPHYHRRGSVDPATGKTQAGQGIGRHRPWETKPTDRSWKDRF